MLLDVKEPSKKIDAVPTIQCRINEPISGCFALVELLGFSTGISIISPFSSSINT